MRAVDYSQYGATTLAAESLRAQLHSQCKLTTPRHENQKIRHENKILKANTTKSHETIPLSYPGILSFFKGSFIYKP
jgi:hypothetical protein